MKKIIIIGAGITGLSTAWKLLENKKDLYKVKVLEKEKEIGGLAKTIKFNNNYVDIGPHSFFSEDREIFNSVTSLFKENQKEIPKVERSVKMFFMNHYVDYPLSAKSILLQMGPIIPILSFLSFAKSFLKQVFYKKKINKDPTIKEWAVDNFGYFLYKNFFKPYTEQFWKIKTEELSHRVIPASKKLDFAKTLKHLLINKYLEISKREPGSLNLVQRESLPTFYPEKGFGEIAKKISYEIKYRNGEIILKQNVKKIIFKNNQFTIFTDKNIEENCDILISTIPLDYLIKNFIPLNQNQELLKHSGQLKYLALIMVYLVIKKKGVLGCQYCYFLNRPYNRVSNLNLFSDKISDLNNNVISLEISCHVNDDTWNKQDNKIINDCIENLVKDKIILKKDIVDYKILRVPNVYPIYKKNYEKSLDYVTTNVDNIKNFYSIGRLGNFYYGDIDQMIRIGFDLAKKIDNNK